MTRRSRDPDRLGPSADAWQIVDGRFAAEHRRALESVFAVGNGYLGVRDAPEEGAPAHDGGVVLNAYGSTRASRPAARACASASRCGDS